ncbi:MAG: C4-dicarboxylate TRAP transporter substrate-binding protein [Acidobacteriaceae bacterium]
MKLPIGAILALSAAMAMPVAAQEITIRVAHSLSTSEPTHLAAEYFAKNLAERSKGRVVLQIFPNQQLGSEKDVNEMMRQGANLMTITDAGYLSDFVPDIGVLAGPYLYRSPDDQTRLIKSDWFKGIEQQLEKSNIQLIVKNGFFGQREIIADRPIRKPADIAGMTIRVPPNTVFVETFKAMGARPATVQWSEVYSALQQNVVAGAEAPLGSLWGSKLYETRKVISMTNHFTAFNYWVINTGYFKRLPPDVQKMLLEEGEKAGAYMTKLTIEKQDGYKDQLRKAGVTIVEDVDIPAFQKVTASVYNAFPKWTPGLHETVVKIINSK